MKIFGFTFIVYLLLLSWQPCQDFVVEDVSCSFAENQQSHLHDHRPSEEAGNCSPFCICSCCQTATADTHLTFSVKSRFTISVEKTFKAFYQNNYSQQNLNSIWQPPKSNFTA
ncbi:MAG: hypothetical protein LH472_13590 [Pyrinomonadaceae bacterium]|nr:hypothetical protein [Pyrinomonadaceae bacterium]